jgi:biopolymer transport protein TolQ
MIALPLPATSAVLYAFETSDLVGQSIVIILFLISIYAWILMLEKSIVVRSTRRQVDEFAERFKTAGWPLDLVLHVDRFSGPLAAVYQAGVEALVEVTKLDPKHIELCCRRRSLPRPLTELELDRIRNAMEQAMARHADQLESRLPVLGTAISVSPLLGLLGTVWGIMVAFVALAEKGRADISALAPGVSGALLTTVAGLVVAIPAAVGYNGLVVRIQRLTRQMDDFVDDMIFALRLSEHD